MAYRLSQVVWPVGFFVLFAASVPAFTGLALDLAPGEIITGLSWGWVIYFCLIHILVLIILGFRLYANIITIAALVALPVVYVGAGVTWLGATIGIVKTGATAAGIHYSRLCLTMLTVVPLALAIVAAIPFSRFERRLLQRSKGITKTQKKILMVLRVFNHTVFFVIPSILEVLREEYAMTKQYELSVGRADKKRFTAFHVKSLLQMITHLAVESICAAVQFIPLWAYEISQLPEPETDAMKKSL